MFKRSNWVYPLVMMAVIFSVSSVTGRLINSAGLANEGYHINGHFILFVLLCAAFYKATKKVKASILLTMVYGVMDEFHQLFVEGRSASFFDIIVDSLGALLAGVVLWKLQHILPKKLRNWLNN